MNVEFSDKINKIVKHLGRLINNLREQKQTLRNQIGRDYEFYKFYRRTRRIYYQILS